MADQPDKVLVTGISGFLGGHVALALLDAGYAVRGSLRDLGKADKVRAALAAASASGNADDLEFVALDLERDDGWRAAAEGCRYLQHVASPLRAPDAEGQGRTDPPRRRGHPPRPRRPGSPPGSSASF